MNEKGRARSRVNRALDRLATTGDLVGCTTREVAEVERHHDVTLPAAYVAFLRRGGRSCADLLPGTRYRYPDMCDLTDGARELLAEHGDGDVLSGADVVFALHQGYTFLWLPTDDGPDPPVYRYVEGEGTARVAERFSSWLAATVREARAADG